MQTQGNNSNQQPVDAYHQQVNVQMLGQVEKFVNENALEYGHLSDSIRKAAAFKNKEMIQETLLENLKKGNYVRIYPAKGSDTYDPYFAGPRPANKLVYKALYGDEVLKCPRYAHQSEMKLKYKIEVPPSTYEHYKKQATEKQQFKSSEEMQYEEEKEEVKMMSSEKESETTVETADR